MKNIKLNDGFKQVCVWPGCHLGNTSIEEFTSSMNEEFGVRVQYLEEIDILSDTDSCGNNVPETGGRTDLFFAIHKEDVGKFAIPRLTVGIRWIEDVLAKCNYHSKIYPERVFGYKSW